MSKSDGKHVAYVIYYIKNATFSCIKTYILTLDITFLC